MHLINCKGAGPSVFTWAGQPSLFQRCLCGRGQRGNSAVHLLLFSTLSNRLLCEIRSFCHHGNHRGPQSALSLSFTFSLPCPPSPPPHLGFSESAFVVHCLTGLVILVDLFFNSLVVGVPCSFIFWLFWLFIGFRLVVILLLVVQGSEGFLPMPPHLVQNSIQW